LENEVIDPCDLLQAFSVGFSSAVRASKGAVQPLRLARTGNWVRLNGANQRVIEYRIARHAVNTPTWAPLKGPTVGVFERPMASPNLSQIVAQVDTPSIAIGSTQPTSSSIKLKSQRRQ